MYLNDATVKKSYNREDCDHNIDLTVKTNIKS